MKNRALKSYAFWILFSEAVGILSALLTRNEIRIFSATVQQPPLTPPGFVFPIIWTILFALMGIGAARVYLSEASADRTQSLLLFIRQLLFNFFWSILFFNLQSYGFALIWLMALWLLILFMILSFGKVDKLAAWLQLPYLLWVSFALCLNFGVWLLNR